MMSTQLKAPKKIMIVNRKAPYGTSDAADALDFALLAAAFDQQVCLAFIDDGVFQLLPNQHPQAIALKNFSAIFKTLDIYDISEVYVEQESIQKRQLFEKDLAVPCHIVSAEQLQQIMQQYEIILSL